MQKPAQFYAIAIDVFNRGIEMELMNKIRAYLITIGLVFIVLVSQIVINRHLAEEEEMRSAKERLILCKRIANIEYKIGEPLSSCPVKEMDLMSEITSYE